MMKLLFREKGAEFRVEILAEPAVQDFIGTHASVLDSAFTKVEMSDAMRRRLQRSNFMFSGLKTFHELNEAFPSLFDDNGNRKPFEQFLNDVRSIDSTYNANYLRAEYNFVTASAEMAAKWEQFMEDGDRYNLQYRTQKDDRVRPEHAALDGVTLPPSDPFWEEFYPPNGWNCRCNVVQVLKSKYDETPHNDAMALGEAALQRDTKGVFRFNPGIEQKTMPDYNPYTIRRCRDCDIATGKQTFARSFMPDNELCAACKLLHKCVGDSEKSAIAIERTHYLYEMEHLLSKKIEKTYKGNTFKIQFTSYGNKHLFSDTFRRSHILTKDDLKNLDSLLEKAIVFDDAPSDPTHHNGYEHFYYLKVQLRDEWIRLNVGVKTRRKGSGQVYRDYTLYSVNDIRKDTRGGS